MPMPPKGATNKANPDAQLSAKSTLESAEFQQACTELEAILRKPLDPYAHNRDSEGVPRFGKWLINPDELTSKQPSSSLGYSMDIDFVPDKDNCHNTSLSIIARQVGRKMFDYVGIFYSGQTIDSIPQQGVFVPRPVSMDLTAFSKHVLLMLMAKEGFSVDKGQLQYHPQKIAELSAATITQIDAAIGTDSFRLPQLGSPKPIGNLRAHPRPFEIPAEISGKTTRRVRSVVTENDSFGKEQWRATMARNFHESFPGGVESIPKNKRLVLCFPGAGGKEADFWLAQGFQQDDLILIERDSIIAAQLRRKYPQAADVICTDVGKIGGRGLDSRLTMYLSKSRPGIGRRVFSVLSFDPEGSITPEFLLSMKAVTAHCATHAFLSANFNLKREGPEVLGAYKKIVSGNFQVAANDQTRQKVLECLPGHLIARYDQSYWRITKLWHGNYEGDSDATRMFWSMANIDLPLAK